jgi:hypothetical protein
LRTSGDFSDCDCGHSGTGGSPSSGSGGATPQLCQDGRNVDGPYLFALSTILNPKIAFAFDAELSLRFTTGDARADLTMQPLSAADQTTPVGESVVFEGLLVDSDGSFEWDLGEVTLPGASNGITGPDVETETTLILTGNLCANSPGFFCGDATGEMSTPFDLELDGSTFTFQKYEETLPSPLINCAKEPAEYPL